MSLQFIVSIFEQFLQTSYTYFELLAPKMIAATIILVFWAIISYAIYRFSMYVFWKFGIVELINSLWEWFEENTTKIVDKTLDDNKEKTETSTQISPKQESKKIRYDRIISKSLSYYIFLLFFRWAIVVLGISEIEKFMSDLIGYLPNLFIGVIIWFFWVRFANSVHDIIYQALELTKDKTSKIIAMWAKIIIMFFTLMIMLNYIQIVDEFIINSLFLGFITTLTISLGLSFGLGGKDIARQILESFRK